MPTMEIKSLNQLHTHNNYNAAMHFGTLKHDYASCALVSLHTSSRRARMQSVELFHTRPRRPIANATRCVYGYYLSFVNSINTIIRWLRVH